MCVSLYCVELAVAQSVGRRLVEVKRDLVLERRDFLRRSVRKNVNKRDVKIF